MLAMEKGRRHTGSPTSTPGEMVECTLLSLGDRQHAYTDLGHRSLLRTSLSSLFRRVDAIGVEVAW